MEIIIFKVVNNVKYYMECLDMIKVTRKILSNIDSLYQLHCVIEQIISYTCLLVDIFSNYCHNSKLKATKLVN